MVPVLLPLQHLRLPSHGNYAIKQETCQPRHHWYLCVQNWRFPRTAVPIKTPNQAGVTAEPSQQQRHIPKKQIGWQWKYTGRLKEGKKSTSKPFCQKKTKESKMGQGR